MKEFGSPLELLVYALPIAAILLWYIRSGNRSERLNQQVMREAIESGMDQPASLHPIVDPVKCIGCRSCIAACPEQESHAVLGIIKGKARLIGPSNCIGHGACKDACPVDAIQLVFGTEKRGVDIPNISPDFQTNIPGVFIAGELGGMGLIKNAVEQGRQALQSIQTLPGIGSGEQLDVVIVGSGPAGFAASLAAKDAGLSFKTIEQDSLGGTVSHFPRGKLVMTKPAVLPIVGKMKFTETSKEKLLEFWQDAAEQSGLRISFNERVVTVTANASPRGFIVTTDKDSYTSRAVLLAIGRRGTPRQLGVPGEDKSKVVYQVRDARQFQNKHVLVVGGGDSALEAASAIASEPGTTVTLSYRSGAFTRAKKKNRELIDTLCNSGKLHLVLNSNVISINDGDVEIQCADSTKTITNDAVIISAGGILPTNFLREIGITVETKHGTV